MDCTKTLYQPWVKVQLATQVTPVPTWQVIVPTLLSSFVCNTNVNTLVIVTSDVASMKQSMCYACTMSIGCSTTCVSGMLVHILTPVKNAQSCSHH